MRGDRRWIAVTSGAGGLVLFAGSVLLPWRSISSGADQGSPDRNIDGMTPQVQWYISGMLGLLLLVEAVLLARGRVQPVLRLLGTALAAALAVLLAVVAARLPTTLTAPLGIDPTARAHVRPGPAFLLAGAAVLACLVAIWAAPRRGTAPPEGRGTLWHLGFGLLVAGLSAVVVSFHLPLLRSYYPDGNQVMPGIDMVIVALPTAMVGAGLAEASLVLIGAQQRALRLVCAGWLAMTALCCNGLGAALWLLQSTDAIAKEHGLERASPGEGLLLGLLGCLLIPLAGALARRRPAGGAD